METKVNIMIHIQGGGQTWMYDSVWKNGYDSILGANNRLWNVSKHKKHDIANDDCFIK